MSLQGKKIGFVGAGNMGEAMIRGLLRSGLSSPADLMASDLRADHLAGLKAALGIGTTLEAKEAAAGAELLVLAVKPQSFPEMLPTLSGKLRKECLVISIAAGVRMEAIQKHLGAQPLIRVMPNTPGLLGQGASAYCLGSTAQAKHGEDAEALLGCLGLVLKVDEASMDAVTALSGSGPAYVFLFMEALQAAGVELGLDEETSFKLAAQTIKGAAAMIERREDTPQGLREKVTSPKGTTAAALEVFETLHFRESVLKAMTAARDRSRELGKA